MRQLAWLNAVPLPPKGSKADDPKFQRSRISRKDRLRNEGVPIAMPRNPAPSVIKHLMELGLTEAAGMGLAPLSWSTIDAWQRVTGIAVPAWEARLIRQLSTEYLAESRRAESENCPAPWRAAVTQREREVEQARLESVLG